MKARNTLVLVILASLSLCACGKKGPLEPPKGAAFTPIMATR